MAPKNQSIWGGSAGSRRKPQIFAGNQRKPQEPAENRRLVFVPLGLSPSARPKSGRKLHILRIQTSLCKIDRSLQPQDFDSIQLVQISKM